ncbi:hypothetical protein ACFQ08_34080, partial [Streptosporangium algeriense]
VGGRADMTPEPSAEALAQLRLRHRLTAATCDEYFTAGFTVVAQDVVLGEHLAEMTRLVRARPLLVVVLAPRAEVVEAREAARAKDAYVHWSAGPLDAVLRERTPRLGLWLDTSEQTPEETVEEILARLPRVAAASARVEGDLRAWVERLRGRGVTWARIGAALGMTRQSAWERFSGEE